jgi:hypothetical protein
MRNNVWYLAGWNVIMANLVLDVLLYLLYPLEGDAGGSVIHNYGSGSRKLINYESTGCGTLFGTLPDGMLLWQTLCLTCFCISCIHWKLMLEGP